MTCHKTFLRITQNCRLTAIGVVCRIMAGAGNLALDLDTADTHGAYWLAAVGGIVPAMVGAGFQAEDSEVGVLQRLAVVGLWVVTLEPRSPEMPQSAHSAAIV